MRLGKPQPCRSCEKPVAICAVRGEYWRREHRAYERQVNAEPNPHYRHHRTGGCPAAVSGQCVSMTEGYALCEPDECVHHPSGQRAEAAS